MNRTPVIFALVLAAAVAAAVSGCSAPSDEVAQSSPSSAATADNDGATSSAAPATTEATPSQTTKPKTTTSKPSQPPKPSPSRGTTRPTIAPSTAGSGFGIGSAYHGKCFVAWPSAPMVTSTNIQMTMSCAGVPSTYPLVVVIYNDPTLPVTPSTGPMTVTGIVQDIAQSGNGLSMPVIVASSVTIP